ncbi:MAG: ATP-dependent DNA ligase [Candidatus Cyclobacteriaceae bacterium M2_1C_046]
MKDFAYLFTRLDQTTKTLVKIEALKEYLSNAPDEDKLWAIALLSHRRPKRPVNTTLLREWATKFSKLPRWLFEESYHIVGDLAETITLVLPNAEKPSDHSLTYWVNYLQQIGSLPEESKKEKIRHAWEQLPRQERFVFNKLITGSFRIGVSQKLMVRALSEYTGIDQDKLAHRLMGHWWPDDTTFEELVLKSDDDEDLSRPYPFYLCYALDVEHESLGDPDQWLAERKWDGIRGQVIVRKGQLFVWSRGEELVTDKYPEYDIFHDALPDGTVLDGEILPWKEGQPLSFNLLQTRIGRKNVTSKILSEAPVIFMAYDLLEYEGNDWRKKPLSQRRQQLEKIISEAKTGGVLIPSPVVEFNSWEKLAEERDKSREYNSEGIMLKKLDSVYKSGRRRGDWWKWKVDPLTIDAVMIYAMRGHGRRSNLYTDYTFAVWDADELVPVTKAYSGLTDDELREVDRFVKKNTTERFGPVRSVTPKLVFEIAFEGINRSSRHKSGVAFRFPRINRWRRDKPAGEADTIENVHQLLEQYG